MFMERVIGTWDPASTTPSNRQPTPAPPTPRRPLPPPHTCTPPSPSPYCRPQHSPHHKKPPPRESHVCAAGAAATLITAADRSARGAAASPDSSFPSISLLRSPQLSGPLQSVPNLVPSVAAVQFSLPLVLRLTCSEATHFLDFLFGCKKRSLDALVGTRWGQSG